MASSFVRKTILAGALMVSSLMFPFAADAGSEVVSSGTFEGRSDHVVTGGVTVLKTESGTIVVLEPTFSLDGAPDPKLGFGKDGYVPSTKFSVLESNTGLQVYQVSEDVDPSQFNEIWVWCEKFNVPLGVAKLQ